MFGLFKSKKRYEQESWDLFIAAQDAARNAYFYENLEVPDTTQGRFDLLLVHIFLIINRIKDEKGGPQLGQALFDTAFLNIDEGYREIGVGDMGVPKRMKKHMLAFNGRMHAYEQALQHENAREELASALDRNLYNLVHFEKPDTLNRMTAYVLDNAAQLQSAPVSDIMAGQVTFMPPETGTMTKES